MPALIQGRTPTGDAITLSFYPGGQTLPDLVIFDGVNHFGKAMYQIDDPLGDIGFRFEDGTRVQAECTRVGKDILGDDECSEYTVYRSSFEAVPEGSIFNRPELF
tara:strand:- start:3336 stop:3650 length:315 start_codon:yes stop_codon:yes gene_type:complete